MSRECHSKINESLGLEILQGTLKSNSFQIQSRGRLVPEMIEVTDIKQTLMKVILVTECSSIGCVIIMDCVNRIIRLSSFTQSVNKFTQCCLFFSLKHAV